MAGYVLKSSVYNVEDLAPSVRQVLTYLIDCNQPQSPKEILERVSCSKRSVQYALKDLTKRNLVERRPSLKDMRTSRYIVKAMIVKNKSYGLVEIMLL
ncbi:MAG: MarR family transcriptional regulator [Candidatus Hodarchaeales archaeon]